MSETMYMLWWGFLGTMSRAALGAELAIISHVYAPNLISVATVPLLPWTSPPMHPNCESRHIVQPSFSYLTKFSKNTFISSAHCLYRSESSERYSTQADATPLQTRSASISRSFSPCKRASTYLG